MDGLVQSVTIAKRLFKSLMKIGINFRTKPFRRVLGERDENIALQSLSFERTGTGRGGGGVARGIKSEFGALEGAAGALFGVSGPSQTQTCRVLAW